jgi:hypothetical protein
MTETLGMLVGSFDEIDLERMDVELRRAMVDAMGSGKYEIYD